MARLYDMNIDGQLSINNLNLGNNNFQCVNTRRLSENTWFTTNINATNTTLYNPTTGDAATSVSSTGTGTWTRVGSFTLKHGIWVITAMVRFANNATGARGITIYGGTDDTITSYVRNRTVRSAAVSGTYTNLQVQFLLNVTEDDTPYSVYATQNSGSTLEVQAKYGAFNI